MAKPTSTYNLIKTYKGLGYSEDGNRYACPQCKAVFLKRYPKADPTTNLYARSVRKVIVFTHPGKTSVAACPCGFRRTNKNEVEKDTRCWATTTRGVRCKNKAVQDGFCATHSPKENPQVVDNGDNSASIHGPVTGVGF